MTVTSPVKLTNLSYLILYVSDTAKSVAFYRDTLGLKVKMESPGWAELETGATTLALHGVEPGHKIKLTEHSPITVFGVECVQTAYEALKAKGIKFEKEPQIVCEEGDKVGKSADFKDPDGNAISIFSFVKK